MRCCLDIFCLQILQKLACLYRTERFVEHSGADISNGHARGARGRPDGDGEVVRAGAGNEVRKTESLVERNKRFSLRSSGSIKMKSLEKGNEHCSLRSRPKKSRF